jgi:signal peptidase I
MLYTRNICTGSNKEPWLAASLSWLLPGMGQLYAGAYTRGASLIVLVGFLHIFWLVSLISIRVSIVILILINLCTSIALPIYASLDAFTVTKRYNTNDFERDRILSKDPWLAVFLSVILPGLGHIYVRRFITGILFFALFLFIRIRYIYSYYSLIGVLVLRALASLHAYFMSPVRRDERKLLLTLLILLLLCTYFLSSFLLPLTKRRFFVRSYGPIIGNSMSPTIAEGSYVMIDKFTYIWRNPKAGEVVVYTAIDDVYDGIYSEGMTFLCKRIIAVGGETVQVTDDQIKVNGEKRVFDIPMVSEKPLQDSAPIDYVADGNNPYFKYGVNEPYYVPEGHYFVLGDNSRDSVDSRYCGAILKEDIIGRVVRIYWPLRSIGAVR